MAVRSFLERRVSFEVFKSASSITDVEIRVNVSRDLEDILSATNAKRIAALTNLMNAMTGSPRVRPELYRTLKALTDEAGYKNNPFLMIAFAATTAYRSETPPDVVKTYIRELQRDGQISFNPYQKTQIFGALSELERLLEESNAFYRTK